MNIARDSFHQLTTGFNSIHKNTVNKSFPDSSINQRTKNRKR